MERTEMPQLGEQLYRDRLPSGLVVYVWPKPGMVRKFATFTTHYGSIDSQFVVPGEDQVTRVPDGIAHFLEHKLFEEPDGNVFDRFAELGADTNAYTYYTTTTYLFSGTDNFTQCLDLLLDFVQSPHFTDENVEKEKGIIEQELRMYQDSPGWRLHSNLLGALFQKHPVRIDIGGTPESIQGIDKDLLYRCYRTFYHPSNMVLLVIGDVGPQAVFEQVRQNQAAKGFQPQPKIRRVFPEEPLQVGQTRVAEQMAVARPILRLGFKETDLRLSPEQQLERELATEIGLEIMLGRSSPLYQKLYEEGLIDEGFGAGYEGHGDYGYTVLGGETRDPDALERALLDGIAAVARSGVSEADFARVRRAMEGRALRLFDQPDSLAFSFNSFYFRGISLLDFLPALRRLTVEQVNRRLRSHFNPEFRAASIILPKAG